MKNRIIFGGKAEAGLLWRFECMKDKISLFAAVLWFFSTGCWTITLFVDFYYRYTPEWLVFLHGVTALTSLTAAVTNYARYKKQRDGISETGAGESGQKEL